MPDQITITDGKAEMFYTGQTPWHGLGTRLDNPATAEEAIAAAALDWKVEKRQAYFFKDGCYRPVDGRYAVIREDRAEPFAILSEVYAPVQNHEAFRFFDDVVGSGEAIYHTAGSLKGGRVVWILAKLPESMTLPGDENDVLERYILLSNSHDGSTAVRMRPTSVRVVCANTLAVALGQKEAAEWSSAHRGNITEQVTKARRLLGLGDAHFEMMMTAIEKLADEKMRSYDREDFYRSLFDIDEEEDYLKSRSVKQVAELYANGAGNSGKTRWDMLNAVTEWVDHKRGSDDNRLHSAWFGSGDALKRNAWELLTVS